MAVKDAILPSAENLRQISFGALDLTDQSIDPLKAYRFATPTSLPCRDTELTAPVPPTDIRGLEFRQRSPGWISVVKRADQSLINVGDMLIEASQGFFASTIHWAIISFMNKSNVSRLFLPSLAEPRPEVVLSQNSTTRSFLLKRLCGIGPQL